MKKELATRLKNKGFPQPNAAAGQFWFYEGRFCFLSCVRENDFVLVEVGTGLASFVQSATDLIFAPTVSDILAEFDQSKCTFRLGRNSLGWVIQTFSEEKGRIMGETGNIQSLVETCAEAYLSYVFS